MTRAESLYICIFLFSLMNITRHTTNLNHILKSSKIKFYFVYMDVFTTTHTYIYIRMNMK